MALSITHPTVATGADDPSKEINKGEWNAAHSIAGLGTGVETALGVNVGTAGAVVVNGGALGTPSSGTLTNATGLPLSTGVTGDLPFANLVQATAASKLVGRGSASGAGDYEEITIGSGLTMTGTTLSASGGSSTWDTIGAAAADGTTANGVNRIVYQVAATADTRISWRFTESAASSGGTSTSGVPNQVLLQLDTLAASTMSPLKVLSRGSHVFSVSPTAAQILAASGSRSNPAYSFAAGTGAGLLLNGTTLEFASGGALLFDVGTQVRGPKGTAAGPTYTENVSWADSGVFFPASGAYGISAGSVENSRFILAGWQPSYGSADAVSYAINARKSRGSVASPTVITTGDDLLTISGYGYVGVTNTYQEAARITFDSTGTIADSATGITGLMRFLTASQANALEPTERLQIDDNQAASETALLISVAGAAVQRVSIGAADSGGTGFRVLRVAN